jgi:hypothetical protein
MLQRLIRRRVAVSAQPVRVPATDHFRQAVAATIKIDRCRFTGITGEDAQIIAILNR